MSYWRSAKARQVLGALLRIGWTVAWQRGSHRRLARAGWPNYTFAFHDEEEIGPGLLAQIAKKTGLRPPFGVTCERHLLGVPSQAGGVVYRWQLIGTGRLPGPEAQEIDA